MKSGRKFRTMTFLAEHNPKHSFLILIPPASLNGRESAKRRQKSSDRKRHSFSLFNDFHKDWSPATHDASAPCASPPALPRAQNRTEGKLHTVPW
ncbi:MAG: hypothetical protein AUH11_13540 [Acidobacteria bacterium 13_2_20CM_57_17]|nr:MAG: hypothetical protein AUH11_13540 [Acidobacteria bacterium 13_2_20CM_57_17]OLB96336.1 MAG: hypothetical protein AUI02_02425 [Acidobacteria bacterium 13_2_20CM_2_57_12]OLE16315.1 MAG: hypothetical protein AUG83_03560 [Acidobacteria bacterium 13_1_20CM_4_57_11]